MALIPLAGFSTTGTSADIPLGAGVKGFVDEDVPLAFAATVSPPYQVALASEPLPVAVFGGSTPRGAATATATAVQ